ncbi:TlpA family protein disulfide reductase [Kushneria phosphatilytica]|uniref:Uncharacterized protein n=1 Tax=Kushneria phosphatilytica TaxID=657387 RepID=A0A1S1NR83_9GAMM|nr:hypothetical protein [Kushneria phosphatilytica]OHV11506.1 hypothetical protein BH688_07050 [Kushneria phosphatilytica]QEL12105.1 hypothetical protein FY550_13810 [Kushneria phosphatilytica]
MNGIAFGPWLIPHAWLYLLPLASSLAVITFRTLPDVQRQREYWLAGLMFSWCLGARLGAVAAAPEGWRAMGSLVLDPTQPGFSPIGGLILACIWTFWWLRGPARRRALALVWMAQLAWLGLNAWHPLTSSPPLEQLPRLSLTAFDGRKVVPAANAGNRPTLILLWRSDCHHCLDTLSQLSAQSSTIAAQTVAINEGESLLQALRQAPGPVRADMTMLLDPRQHWLTLTRAPGLPALMLFDHHGRLIDSHAGAMSPARWREWRQHAMTTTNATSY